MGEFRPICGPPHSEILMIALRPSHHHQSHHAEFLPEAGAVLRLEPATYCPTYPL